MPFASLRWSIWISLLFQEDDSNRWDTGLFRPNRTDRPLATSMKYYLMLLYPTKDSLQISSLRHRQINGMIHPMGIGLEQLHGTMKTLRGLRQYSMQVIHTDDTRARTA